MTPNELGQLCYEACINGLRFVEVKPTGGYRPWYALSRWEQLGWEEAGVKCYQLGRGDEFRSAYNEGFTDGFDQAMDESDDCQ